MLNCSKRLGCRLVCGLIVLTVSLETVFCGSSVIAERFGGNRRGRRNPVMMRSQPVQYQPATTSRKENPKENPETGTQEAVQDEATEQRTKSAKMEVLNVQTPVQNADLALRTEAPKTAVDSGTVKRVPCYWFTNWEEAQQAAEKFGRPMLIHFSLKTCGPCRQMEARVFSQETIQMLAGSYFVMVKIDGEARPDICSRYKVSSYPADVVLAPDGTTAAHHIGKQELVDYSTFLTAAAEKVNLPPMKEPIGKDWRTLAVNTELALADGNSGLEDAGEDLADASEINQTLAVPATGDSELQGFGENVSNSGNEESTISVHEMNEGAVDILDLEKNESLESVSMDSGEKKELPLAEEFDLLDLEQGNEHFVHKVDIQRAGLETETKVLLDGYCPVSLVEKNEWVKGSPSFVAWHEGAMYFFASKEAEEKFMLNPAYYALVSNGCDIVALVDHSERITGSRKFGVRYENLNFVFVNSENREKFRENPAFYSAKVKEIAIKPSETDRVIR